MDFLQDNETQVIRNIMEPDLFEPDSFEAIPIGMGVTMITGKLKNRPMADIQINPDRVHVQGVIFEKPTWDVQNALDWLRENQRNFVADPEQTKANFAKETHSINGVEVFSVGKWNGQNFTEADLDKMVETFNQTSATVRPYLKLGHDDEQALLKKEGLPAAGWVASLYRKGGKLVADFVDIPKKIYELIENKAYRKVSIELFRNVEILDNRFDFLISGIALLGAETPGVLNLKDILDRFNIKSYDTTCTFTHESEQFVTDFPGGEMDKDLVEAKALIKELEKDLAKSQKDAEKFQKTADTTADQMKKLEDQLKEQKEQFAKTAKELKQKEITAQVAELKAEGVITPAMEKGVFQLLDEEVAKFSIEEDKECSRFELVKQLFSLAKDGDVNTDEKTVEGDLDLNDKKDLFSKIDKEIEEYAVKNEVTYGEAYSIVTEKYQDQLQAAE